MTTPDDQKKRFFVITPGRTGSSLLCALLSDAGGDFNLSGRTDWSPSMGEYEHPTLIRAQMRLRRAHALNPDKPARILEKFRWDVLRHKGKADLAEALAQACFLKANDLDLAVPLAFKLGYFPQVILNVRPFEPAAASLYIRRTYSTVDELADKYNRILKNGMMLMHLFGGCVVDYATMMNAEATTWARHLGELTGLDDTAILDARRARLKSDLAAGDHTAPLNPVGDALYDHIMKAEVRVHAPSRPVLRAWQERHP